MPEVRPAVRAAHLRPDRAERPVLDEFHPILGERGVERRPSAVRVELVLAAEQLGAAGAAPVDTDGLVGLVGAGERTLRPPASSSTAGVVRAITATYRPADCFARTRCGQAGIPYGAVSIRSGTPEDGLLFTKT